MSCTTENSTISPADPADAAAEEISIEGRPRASLPLVVLSTLGVLTAMYVARDVIVPVVFAVFLALLLRPVLRRTRRWHVPDAATAFVLVAAVVVVYVVSIYTLASQAQKWLSDAPEMLSQVSRMLPIASGPFGDLAKTTAAVKELTEPAGAPAAMPVEVKSNDMAVTALGVSGRVVGTSVIVFVLAFFLLAMCETLLRQAVCSRSSFQSKRNVVRVVQNVEQGISRYLFTITLINIGLGAATAAAMWLLDIPNPILWGVMAGTLNYVPHVGAFACMVVLFFVGAVSHQSIALGGLAAGTFAVLTSIESYLVTPLVLSRSLQLSPLAVILSILFWGWLWGIPGGLMAAPILAVVKITCDQFDSLQGVAALLAGESPATRGASEPHDESVGATTQAA